jgi:hypothetical protein
MPRFPPRGPLGTRSPASTVLSRHYDFLTPLPPRFVSFAWRYHGSARHVSSLPPPPNAKRRARGWLPGIPIRVCFRGDDRISQVPGEPPFPFAHALRPRPADAPLTKAGRSRGPRYGNDEGADDKRLSRLNRMASGLAAYVSRAWLPAPAQGSLPGAGQALLNGLSTRRAPLKGFQLTSCSLSSFPKLLGTIPFSLRENWDSPQVAVPKLFFGRP